MYSQFMMHGQKNIKSGLKSCLYLSTITRRRVGLSGVRIPADQGIFLFLETYMSALGPYPFSWSMVTGVLYQRKAAGAWSNHPHPSSAEVKNAWRYTSASPLRLHVMDREKFTYTLNWKGNMNSQRVPWL